ncbi:MAG: biopolymer transporter ExbD [Pirellulaceae bacterium]|nr:biopolymer transporter ExbD [Pirellulaceae bacterium]
MPIVLKKSRVLDSLNMTPLIDCVFILLIFFLVATRFAQEDRELPVQLPSAQSAIPMTMEPQILTVGINEEGSFAIDGKMIPIEDVEVTIRQAVADNPINQTVIIRGDKRVPFQHVVSVMDVCQRLKVPTYKVTTTAQE